MWEILNETKYKYCSMLTSQVGLTLVLIIWVASISSISATDRDHICSEMQRPRQWAVANSNQMKPYFWLKMVVVITPQEFTTALAIVICSFSQLWNSFFGLHPKKWNNSCVSIWLWIGSLKREAVTFDALIFNSNHLLAVPFVQPCWLCSWAVW